MLAMLARALQVGHCEAELDATKESLRLQRMLHSELMTEVRELKAKERMADAEVARGRAARGAAREAEGPPDGEGLQQRIWAAQRAAARSRSPSPLHPLQVFSPRPGAGPSPS